MNRRKKTLSVPSLHYTLRARILDTTEEMNMDLQDLQDNRRSNYLFGEITGKIIGCAFYRNSIRLFK